MRHRILVVAQDVTLRSRLARWLMSAGYIVELAESSRRVREVFASHKVDLTILAKRGLDMPALGLHQARGKLIVVAEQSQGGRALDSAWHAVDGCLSMPLREQEVLACTNSLLPVSYTHLTLPTILLV